MADDARQIDAIKIGIYADVAGLEKSLQAAQSVVAKTEFNPKDMTVRVTTLAPTKEAISGLRKQVQMGVQGREGTGKILIPVGALQNSIKAMATNIQTELTKANIKVTVSAGLDAYWLNLPKEVTVKAHLDWDGQGPPSGGGGRGPTQGPPGPNRGPSTPSKQPSGGGTAVLPQPSEPKPPGSRPVKPRASQQAVAAVPAPTAPREPAVFGPAYVHGPVPSRQENLGLRPHRGAAVEPGAVEQFKRLLSLAMQGDPAKLLKHVMDMGGTITGQGGQFGVSAPKGSAFAGIPQGADLVNEALAHRRRPLTEIAQDFPPGTINLREFGIHTGAAGEKIRTGTTGIVDVLRKAQRSAIDLLLGKQNPKTQKREGGLLDKHELSPEDIDTAYGSLSAVRTAQDLLLTADPKLAKALVTRKAGPSRASDPLTSLLSITEGLRGATYRLTQQSELRKAAERYNKELAKRETVVPGPSTSETTAVPTVRGPLPGPAEVDPRTALIAQRKEAKLAAQRTTELRKAAAARYAEERAKDLARNESIQNEMPFITKPEHWFGQLDLKDEKIADALQNDPELSLAERGKVMKTGNVPKRFGPRPPTRAAGGPVNKAGHGGAKTRHGGAPSWALDGMLRRRIDPDRPLNDVDMGNKSVRWAVAHDPSIGLREKINVFKTGSPRGYLSDEEIAEARQKHGLTRAEGGPVKGGLMARMAAAKAAREGTYLVGEKRPELFVGDSGHTEIIGRDGPEIRGFPEHGKVLPSVPEWRRRAAEGLNKGKDLTGREAGGPVEADDSGYTTDAKGRRHRPGGQFASDDPGKEFLAGQKRANDILQNMLKSIKAGGPLGSAIAQAEEVARRLSPATGKQMNQDAVIKGLVAETDNIQDLIDTLSPQQQARVALMAQQRAIPGLLKGVQIRADVTESISKLAQRSAPLAAGQFLSTVGGRGTAVEQGRMASFFVSEAGKAEAIATGFEKRRFAAIEKQSNAEAVASVTGVDLTKEIKEQSVAQVDLAEAAEMARRQAGEYNVIATQTEAKIASGGKALRNFGLQISGALTGTLLYGGAFTGLQVALEAGAKVAEPMVDSLSGFYLTTQRVTSAVADQTKAQNGNAKAAAIATVAQTGLSGAVAKSVSSTLALRAAGETANENLQTQLELVRTQNQVQKQNQALGTNGLDRSVLFGTGGLDVGAPGNLFGTPSTAESVAQGLRPIQGGRDLQRIVSSAGITGGFNPVGLSQDVFKTLGDLVGGGSPENIGAVKPTIAAFNADLAKGGSQFQIVQHAQADQILATTQAFGDLGQALPELKPETDELASSFKAAGLAIVDAQGKVVTSAGDLAYAFNALQQGALKPSAEALVQNNEIPRAIQQQVMAAQAQRQLETTIPAGEALDFLSNRPLPVGAGVTPISGTGAAGGPGAEAFGGPAADLGKNASPVDPAAIRSFGEYKQAADDAMNDIITKASAGRTALAQLGVPPALIQELEGLGQQVFDIQLGQANKEAALAAQEYNHQLFIAHRSEADALGLAGKRTNIESGLVGVLERQSFELQKQSQQLSFQLQQRQINFQVAVAGFQAPGVTSEEREARQKEAIIEATYAQKQLNIARAQFKVGIRLFDENAIRQLNDVRFALADLQRSHEVQISGKLAQQTIALLQRHIASVQKRIGVVIDTAENQFASAMAEATQAAISGASKDFGVILKMTGDAWGIFGEQASNAASAIINGLTGTGTPATSENLGGSSSGHHAAGMIASASSPTTITYGEAGSETAAIIRNTRNVTIGPSGGGSGGGPNIMIMVTGNTVRDDADIEKLTRRISREVERTFMARGAQLGLRTFASAG